MARVTIPDELRRSHPELARQFETEMVEALSAAGTPDSAEARIHLESAAGAMDRALVVLTGPSGICEWSLALPVTPGDVRRAAESALGDRRTQEERRHDGRRPVDRRRS